MKLYLKQFLLRGFCGVFIGSFIGHTIYVINALQTDVFEVTSSIVLMNYFASALVGFWCSSVSIVYDIDEWSILRQTVTHALLISPYIPFAFYLGWAPSSLIGRIIYVIFYVLIYSIVWLSFKTYWSRRARELNQELEKLKETT